MRTDRGAADRVAPAGTAGQTRDDAPSIPDDEQPRNKASDAPGVVSAWARWRSAFRLAVHALGRGPQ
jgi:hypothetical protein